MTGDEEVKVRDGVEVEKPYRTVVKERKRKRRKRMKVR